MLVNSFAEAQTESWRAVAIAQDANSFVEVGWITREDQGPYQAHPFRLAVTRGNRNYRPKWDVNLRLAQMHEFKVHDSNDDGDWSFAYDGIAMGDMSASADQGESITESERNCTSDSLFAEFRNLSKCAPDQGCGWSAYGGLRQYIDTANGSNPYDFCWVGPRAYDVRQSC